MPLACAFSGNRGPSSGLEHVTYTRVASRLGMSAAGVGRLWDSRSDFEADLQRVLTDDVWRPTVGETWIESFAEGLGRRGRYSLVPAAETARVMSRHLGTMRLPALWVLQSGDRDATRRSEEGLRRVHREPARGVLHRAGSGILRSRDGCAVGRTAGGRRRARGRGWLEAAGVAVPASEIGHACTRLVRELSPRGRERVLAAGQSASDESPVARVHALTAAKEVARELGPGSRLGTITARSLAEASGVSPSSLCNVVGSVEAMRSTVAEVVLRQVAAELRDAPGPPDRLSRLGEPPGGCDLARGGTT